MKNHFVFKESLIIEAQTKTKLAPVAFTSNEVGFSYLKDIIVSAKLNKSFFFIKRNFPLKPNLYRTGMVH